MPNGNRCDGPGCLAFAPPSSRWLYLVQQGEEHPVLASLGIGRTEPLTFCSALCVAGYCYALAMTESPATGTEPPPRREPPPRSGVGWPS